LLPLKSGEPLKIEIEKTAEKVTIVKIISNFPKTEIL